MEDISLIKYSIYSMIVKSRTIKQSTLYHLLNGKRTSYMLYYAYSHKVCGYYALFPRLKITQFNDIIAQMVLENQLILGADGYLVQGEKDINYLGSCLLGEIVDDIHEFGLISPSVLDTWIDSFRLLAQVLGNSSYQEYRYAPLQDNIIIQQALKKWLSMNQINLKNKYHMNRVIYELEDCLKAHSNCYNLLFLSMLDTKYHISETTEQRIQRYLTVSQEDMDKIEKLVWKCFFSNILKKQQRYPLLYSWYCNQMNYFGIVSLSCRQTEILYRQGDSIEQMMHKRHLKQTTIQDHLMEIAIMSQSSEFINLLPNNKEVNLWRRLKQNPDFPYKKYYETYYEEEPVPFFSYRLLQIYQLKKYWEEQQND